MSSPEENSAQDLFPEYGITQYEIDKFGLSERPVGAMSPEEAQQRLENMGYDPSLWERLVTEKIGSHGVQAFAIIALGNGPRLEHVLNTNFRVIDYFDNGRQGKLVGVEQVMTDPAMQTEALRRVLQDVSW